MREAARLRRGGGHLPPSAAAARPWFAVLHPHQLARLTIQLERLGIPAADGQQGRGLDHRSEGSCKACGEAQKTIEEVRQALQRYGVQ